ALDGDALAALAGLEEEHAGARLADRDRREPVDVLELVEHAHDGVSSASEPPVELTVSAIGPFGVQDTTDTEQVEITIRWNRSRWVPSAWATAALIGSAWLTHTITPPGWRARRSSSVDTMRVCIS